MIFSVAQASWQRRTSELAFYRCYAPALVPLAVLVMVAGRRWTIEESFQTAHSMTDLLRWSRWRRRHQARAQASRYRRQALYEP